MATAKRREAWDHTSSVCACILNARQGVKKSRLVSARQLHPLRRDVEDAPCEVLHGDAARSALRGAFSG